jgi:hypothetical protein
MSGIGLGSLGVVRFGASSSPDDQPVAGFEELAMPLFDPLYNFARWLVRNSNDAEDLVQETYLKGFAQFRLLSAWHQFPGVDVSNPEKHVSEFALKTRAPHDRCGGLGGGRA